MPGIPPRPIPGHPNALSPTQYPTGAPSGSDPTQLPHMHGGWADLRNSVNKHLPRQLETSDTATRAAYRVLAGKTRRRR